MTLAVLSAEDLAEIVAKAVRVELAKAVIQPPIEVLTLKQCAELLDLTTKTVMKLVTTSALPAHYLSEREPRFRRSEVLAWVSSRPDFWKEIAA